MDAHSSDRIHKKTHLTPTLPWSVDRWGRLIVGASILFFMVLGLLVHPLWLWGSVLAAINLIATSLTNRCPMHALLMRLGAVEREDLFWPGGRLRNQKRSEKIEVNQMHDDALYDQPPYALIKKLAKEASHVGERS